MADSPIQDPGLGFLITDLARLIRDDFTARMADIGMTQAQWRVLTHLARMEGCRQAELAEILEVAPITLARLLDRLEESGLIERRPRPGDRRAVQLMLTPKARPLIRKIWARGTQTRTVALTGVSDAERDAMFATLIRMRDNLAARPAPSRRTGGSHGR